MDTKPVPVPASTLPPMSPRVAKNVGLPPVPGQAKPGGPPLMPVAAGLPGGPPQLSGLLPGEEPRNPDEEEQFHHASGFFNQPWVQNLMPFATSLVFHLTIIIVGIFLFKELPKLVSPNKEQTIIPDTKQLGQAKMPGGTLHPGPAADPTRDVAQNVTQDTKDDGLADHPSDNMNAAAGGGGGDSAQDFRGSHDKGGSGHSSGGGSGDGFGSGSGGSPAPYGTPGGGDGHTGPKSPFYGTDRGNADKIVYLVDTSGSMIGVFGDVKSNLKKEVMALPADIRTGGFVSFDIITFSDEKEPRIFSKTITKGAAALQLGTPDMKAKAAEFIDDQVASGGTLPMPAIKAAFNYSPKPQLIDVMTDGFDNVASFDEVVNAFKDGTKDGMTKVNCIHFVAEPDPKLVQVLEEIATDGHGQFKQINKADMQ